MKHNREFEIAWLGLKEAEHIYDFSIDDVFMQAKGVPEELKDWKAHVRLKFVKHSSFFQLHFDISGSVVVPCDRCGDEFKLELWDEFELIVKLTAEGEKIAEAQDEADVVFVPRTETVLDVSAWLYEFVMLSLPLHKLHPEDSCNPKALALLQELSVPDEHTERSVWSDLKKIQIAEEEQAKSKQAIVKNKKLK